MRNSAALPVLLATLVALGAASAAREVGGATAAELRDRVERRLTEPSDDATTSYSSYTSYSYAEGESYGYSYSYAAYYNRTQANQTASYEELYEEYNCAAWALAPIVHLASVPVWIAMGAYWWWSVYVRHSLVALDLQRLLLWVPFVEVIHGMLSILYFWACPWYTTGHKVLAAMWVVVAILKEPIMLVCLLMVAKGWCITRLLLSSREIAVSALIITCLYAAVIVQMSVRSMWALTPVLVMYSAMLLNVMLSILTNLRILKAQLLALRYLNIDATTTPAYTKYRMFVVLCRCASAYFLLDVGLFVVDVLLPAPPWLMLALRQLLELTAAWSIGYAFRARPFNVMFQQVQQLALDLAEQFLPQVTTVELNVSELRGDGTVPWSDALELTPRGVVKPRPAAAQQPQQPPPPVLMVLNPGESEVSEVGGTSLQGSLVVAYRVDGGARNAARSPPPRPAGRRSRAPAAERTPSSSTRVSPEVGGSSGSGSDGVDIELGVVGAPAASDERLEA